MSSKRYNFNMIDIKRLDARLRFVTTSAYGGDWHSILHTHHFTEVFYITSGRGEFIVEEEKLSVSANDFIVINPKVRHTEMSMRKSSLEYVVLGIEDLSFLFDSEANKKNYSVFKCPVPDKTLDFFFHLLCVEIRKKETNYELICQNTLESLLLYIMRNYNCGFSIISSSEDNIRCAYVKKYIDDHFKEKITLDNLADVVHINKYYLSHAYSKCYNISPINYLIDRRIQESKTLLLETDYSVTQISLIVGFSSPSYFSQTFKKSLGKSPAEFRMMFQNKEK